MRQTEPKKYRNVPQKLLQQEQTEELELTLLCKESLGKVHQQPAAAAAPSSQQEPRQRSARDASPPPPGGSAELRREISYLEGKIGENEDLAQNGSALSGTSNDPRAQALKANPGKFPHHGSGRAVLDWFGNIQNIGVELSDVDRIAAITQRCLADHGDGAELLEHGVDMR